MAPREPLHGHQGGRGPRLRNPVLREHIFRETCEVDQFMICRGIWAHAAKCALETIHSPILHTKWLELLLSSEPLFFKKERLVCNCRYTATFQHRTRMLDSLLEVVIGVLVQLSHEQPGNYANGLSVVISFWKTYKFAESCWNR